MLIKEEIRKLSSVYLNGQLMYSGKYKFVWIELFSGMWYLISIEPEK